MHMLKPGIKKLNAVQRPCSRGVLFPVPCADGAEGELEAGEQGSGCVQQHRRLESCVVPDAQAVRSSVAGR